MSVFKILNKTKIYYGVYDNALSIHSNEINSLAIQGQSILLEIKKTLTNKLGRPYNQCTDEISDQNDLNSSPLAKEIASRGSEYRQIFCFRLCLLHFIEKACNCILPLQLDSRGNDTCELNCIKQVKKTFDFDVTCGDECPFECDSVTFDFGETKRILSEDYSLQDVINKKFSNQSGLEKSYNFTKIVAFDINFKSLSFVELSEIPKSTYTNLIADFGGTIGKKF